MKLLKYETEYDHRNAHGVARERVCHVSWMICWRKRHFAQIFKDEYDFCQR